MEKIEKTVTYKANPNHWFTIGRKIINMRKDGWHFLRTGVTHLGHIAFIKYINKENLNGVK